MSDPLSGLLGAEEGQRPPPRRPLPPPRRRHAGFGRLFVAIIIMAGLVAAVIFGGKALISNLTHTKKIQDYAGQGTGSVDVSIKNGQSATSIGNMLVSDDVVKTVESFTAAANADPDRASKIQPGNYILRMHVSGAAAFNLLFNPSARNRDPLHRGRRSRHAAGAADHRQGHRVEARGYAECGQSSGAAWTSDLGSGCQERGRFPLPGHLRSPARARPQSGCCAAWSPGSTWRPRSSTWSARRRLTTITPLQAVTLASIVEKEVNKEADQGKAARVLYNRLNDTADFPTLGMDSTTRYALGGFSGTLTQSQLAINSPYNTRVYPGIPPGPIGNPGESTLKAVLAPTPGDWTFFIYLPKEKETLFTPSSSQFYAWQQQFCQETHESTTC